MEKLIDLLGECFLKINLLYENFFEKNVKKNDTTLIAFLMIPLLLFAIFLVSVNGFIPLQYKSKFLFFYSLLGLLMIILTAGYYRGVKKRQTLGYNFKMIRFNFSKINLSTLGFSEADKHNLILICRNRRVENKIDNTNLVKNKSAASYSFLFSLFHVIIQSGIKDLNTTDRQNFFQMLKDSFTMNGDAINPDTLNSSYSKWKSKLINDENNLNDLKIIRTVFNKE
jgi:hypothetical protein